MWFSAFDIQTIKRGPVKWCAQFYKFGKGLWNKTFPYTCAKSSFVLDGILSIYLRQHTLYCFTCKATKILISKPRLVFANRVACALFHAIPKLTNAEIFAQLLAVIETKIPICSLFCWLCDNTKHSCYTSQRPTHMFIFIYFGSATSTVQ